MKEELELIELKREKKNFNIKNLKESLKENYENLKNEKFNSMIKEDIKIIIQSYIMIDNLFLMKYINNKEYDILMNFIFSLEKEYEDIYFKYIMKNLYKYKKIEL